MKTRLSSEDHSKNLFYLTVTWKMRFSSKDHGNSANFIRILWEKHTYRQRILGGGGGAIFVKRYGVESAIFIKRSCEKCDFHQIITEKMEILSKDHGKKEIFVKGSHDNFDFW